MALRISGCVAPEGPIASRLAPTGVCIQNVGASLLAMAPEQAPPISGILQHRFNLPQIALDPPPINRPPLTNPITPGMVTRAIFLFEFTHDIQIRQRRD